ncbi:hypothetical protein CSKR_104226 [Clonorchis sinensis]|uniref:E3 ubiquitin-protein ligase mind-bomb n=2 Tax=Clonorchis sinensis TaxID=79923 RepID=G7YBA8_CLOSI|nr:hypothetical protein CSKR_104226 [Clonorchis sinensis]GAA50242.1 E3 ubiquitin-protein ligase mind-bomb [Clonorchis sinensis]
MAEVWTHLKWPHNRLYLIPSNTSPYRIVRVILQHCLQQTPWLVDEPQADGLTALHLASLHGHLEVSDLLLQSGANPNATVYRPSGLQPPPTSVRSTDGAYVPAFTPLHLAVHKAHPDVVCLLLCYGARAAVTGGGARAGEGRSPMQLALTTLAQTQDNIQHAGQTPRRFDVALVPFLASVARLLICMADSLALTSSAPVNTSIRNSSPLRANASRTDCIEEAQLISIEDTGEGESVDEVGEARDIQQGPVRLTSQSPLCRRLKSTVQATLETGVPRLVLIAACLASAIGAESWTPNCSNDDDDEVRNIQMITDNFVTDIFTECLDPVLQLALQQCHMEAMNSVSQIRSQAVNVTEQDNSRSQRRTRDLLADLNDSEEENLVDTFFQADHAPHSTVSLLPSTVSTSAADEFMLHPGLVTQSEDNRIQPVTIANQLGPQLNNQPRFVKNPPQSLRLLPPKLTELDVEWRECLVCSDRDRSTVILPCGHIITCENCTPLMRKCLLCRQRVSGSYQFSNCCECNQFKGVVLAKPCNHMLWCKDCIKTKVEQLDVAAGHLEGLGEFGSSAANSDTLLLADHVVDERADATNNQVTNEWQAISLGRLFSMVTTVNSLMDDLLAGGLCIDGCPVCSQPVETLWPIVVSCAGVDIQSTGALLRNTDGAPSPSPALAPILDSVQRTNAVSTPVTNPLVFSADVAPSAFAQNELTPHTAPLNLSPRGCRTLDLTQAEPRQPIAPNNRIHHTSMRTRHPQLVQLCDRELSKLKHELQVMREQIRCPICLDRSRNLVFMCGHATCQWCGDQVTACPICRRAVESRIILY